MRQQLFIRVFIGSQAQTGQVGDFCMCQIRAVYRTPRIKLTARPDGFSKGYGFVPRLTPQIMVDCQK